MRYLGVTISHLIRNTKQTLAFDVLCHAPLFSIVDSAVGIHRIVGFHPIHTQYILIAEFNLIAHLKKMI